MIGIVACCKTKRDHVAAARELYTSPLFRMSLAYARSRCSTVYVASAQHQLLELDRVIAPYNRTMADLTIAERRMFGDAIARDLIMRHSGTLDLLVLAGAAYVDPIRDALARECAIATIREPLAGMQIGQRLSFLRRAA